MGLFDLRCGLSRMSTTRPFGDDEGNDRPSLCSVFMLEKWKGTWVPLSPPVSGVYNRYGCIELRAQHQNAHSRWVEGELDRAFSQGRLETSSASFASELRQELSRQKDLAGSPQEALVPPYLQLAVEVIYNGVPLTFAGREVRPAIFIDDVARALTSPAALPRIREEEAFLERLARRSAPDDDPDLEPAYAAWLTAQQRPKHAAYLAALHDRRQAGYFAQPPAESAPILELLHRVMRWTERRGGLVAIKSADARQQSRDDHRHYAHEAWRKGEPGLTQLIEQRRPGWAERWSVDDRARAARKA